MTLFTNNRLEKLMQELPNESDREPAPTAPPDHFCFGCVRYGQGCVAPCYRELLHFLQAKNKTCYCADNRV